MPRLWANNAVSTLAAGIAAGATTLTVPTGEGDLFPVVTAPDTAILTLEDAAGNIEIIQVTARAAASDSLTIVRAQEGTTARAWAAGDLVELRLTAGAFEGALKALFGTTLTINRVLTSNASGQIIASGTITVTELGYINGVTSNIQTQLDAKLPLAGGTLTGTLNATSVTLSGNASKAAGSVGEAFIAQDTTDAPFMVTATQAADTYYPAVKIRCTGPASTRTYSFGTLVNTDNTISGVIHGIDGTGDTNNVAWQFRSNGDFYSYGNVIAYSDIRLKTDLKVIEGALDKVLTLNGYTYTDTQSGDRRTGVVAQEVLRVLPEAVAQGGEYMGVAYGNMVGLLIEAIKEQQAQIDELKAKVAA